MTARPFASVRLRITAAATVVFGLTFGLAAFGLVARVRSALETDAERQSTEAVSRIEEGLQAGMPIGPIVGDVSGKGVVLLFQTPDGQFISAPDVEQTFATPLVVGTAGGGEAGGTGAAGSGPNDPGVGTGAQPAGVAHGELPMNVRVAGPEPGLADVVVRRDIDTPGGGELTVIGRSSMESARTTINTLGTMLLVGTPTLVALVGALVWLLVGRALRPVETIRAEVDEITHSTLDRRVDAPGTGDEIDRLAVTMNQMLDRLDGAASAQRRFVSDASHELKTPMATNRARLELALRHPETTDWVGVGADLLATEERLERLVADLLDMARLEEDAAGNEPLATVDIATVARDVVRLAHESHDRPDVSLTVSAPAAVTVTGSPADLARLVQNLTANAVRHAAHHVTVTVRAQHDRTGVGTAVLEVDDDGEGIPVADRERVFGRFARLDNSRQRASGGTGLGLAIARAIVDGHGGTITAGDAPAGGARLTVLLPLRRGG